jgi:chromosome partitioning protein
VITIAVANQKGGVGKTTSAINLGQALHDEGRRVLLIDVDPQGSLTVYCGLDPVALAEQGRTVSDALVGDADKPLSAVIVERDGGPDVVAASIDLAGAELELSRFGAQVLEVKLREVRDRYDVVLIDCPPSLSILTANALTAADSVLIPVKTDRLSMQGIKLLLETVGKIRTRANPDLEVLGILPTLYNKGFQSDDIALELLTQIAPSGVAIFDPIPRSTAFDRSNLVNVATVTAEPDAPGAQSYRCLAKTLAGIPA